jgi:Rho termination factor, N-terminal domain
VAEEPGKRVAEMTVAELRARASELEITGRSAMKKDELRQAVADAEVQLEGVEDGGSGEKPASEIPAPSIGPHTEISKDPPEVRLAGHEQSDVDALGLDKRRAVVGKRYGASVAKQATVYGVFLLVVAALVVGGKLAADELDKGPEVNPDNAAWAQEGADQRPPGDIDFPPSVSP